MKINLIYGEFTPDITTDLELLTVLFKKIKQKIEIQRVEVLGNKCPKASINIFFNFANIQFINNAKCNILIADHTCFNKLWLETLPLFDVVYTKTEKSLQVLKSYLSSSNTSCNIVNLGWRCPNVFLNKEKDYDEVLLYCSKDIDYNKIIKSWDKTFPTLNVVLETVKGLEGKEQSNILYHNKIKQADFLTLFNNSGIYIGLKEYENYDIFMNQAKMAKSIVIGFKNNELLDESFSYLLKPIKKQNKLGLGYSYKFDVNELCEVIKKIQNSSEDHLILKGKLAHDDTIYKQGKFDELFKTEFIKVIEKTRTIKSKDDSLTDLPSITIVTPTYNRKRMFRLPMYVYNTMDYPKENMEWIIIDDSEEETLVDLIPESKYLEENGMDINYIKLDKKITIGAKRNMGCEIAKHDIIIFMDDDDYYFKTSFKDRVKALVNSEKNCIGTSTYGCFEINRYISMVHIDLEIKPSRRPSTASLCFYKTYWINNRFKDQNKGEAEDFIDILDYGDIGWEDNFISLIHSKNVLSDKIKDHHNRNGCKFNISKKMFRFLTTLDKNSDLEDQLREEK